MADPLTLTTLLVAGGTVVAQATIEEATKEAWSALKGVLQDLFGRRVSSCVAKLEVDGTREAGRSELNQLLGTVTDDEAASIEPVAERFRVALKSDPAARSIIERSSINLDLDTRGSVTLQRISGADTINVRSSSDGDFTLTDVAMGRGPASGN